MQLSYSEHCTIMMLRLKVEGMMTGMFYPEVPHRVEDALSEQGEKGIKQEDENEVQRTWKNRHKSQ